ncbi:beta-lactamase domain protein [Anaeromyxobacter sp. K]|uniref:MBL fold metallo-hydrolase n=1 Tax=Anaeromyxobacter sp. (strain K) TaxID=447217 RepID=UPI00015F9D1B|nr:MBL fold metallo-hydrolase [Anaeromyxobacter sp. K]ACG71297.1 beta-lactamase domain protein [Anaeromyxobacter sp. K]
MTEADLEGLGVHRIAIPVPFPQAGGPVNAYLVEEAGGGLLMFDSGLGTPEAQAALEAGFQRLGRRFDEVDRIVVSHGHVDHYGAARFVQERHGGPDVPVFGHPADAPKMSEQGPRWRELAPRLAAYLARQGVPPEVVELLAKQGEGGFRYARRLPEIRPIAEGEVLRTRHLALEVMHMPGHTPGLLCLYEREKRLFLSDDHLLEKVSPNPLIELGPDGQDGFFRPLLAYLDSIRRLRALEVDLVLPGHGPPFGGHREIIDALLGFYAKRQARLLELLQGGPQTAHELARALWPRARPTDAFLTLSETVANLEVMESRGEVRRDRAAEPWRYLAA